MRRAARVDGNHNVVVNAFRARGCSVQSLAAVGKGVPDLLVAFAGLNHLVEVKDGRKVKSARNQTPAQVVWASTWRAPRHLVESVEDVQRLVKAWKTQRPVEMEVVVHGGLIQRREVRPKRGLALLLGAMSSDVEVDASDYERPMRPGEWIPMPHADSPTVKE